MSRVQIFTPILPYVGRLPGGELRYGSRIKFRGHFREPQDSLHVILQKEALLNPHEDVPLYITIHPGRKELVRNHISEALPEERIGNCPIECGQDFELTIVPTASGYEIALYGTPFHTFGYRVPLSSARYLFVSSGCIIFAINFENWNATASSGEQQLPHEPQLPTAPPLQLPGLYPSLEQPQQQQQQQQQQPAQQSQHPRHIHHSAGQPVSPQPNVRELVLQVLPLVHLAASQLQANSNHSNHSNTHRSNASNALLGIEALSHLLPLFHLTAATTDGRKLVSGKGRGRAGNRCAFWRSCGARLNHCEALPAAILACSFGMMRLFRFLVIAGVFGYIGYVFSRNT